MSHHESKRRSKAGARPRSQKHAAARNEAAETASGDRPAATRAPRAPQDTPRQPSPPPPRLLLAAFVLIAGFCLQSLLISRNMSPTSDEPPHLAAGLSYLSARVFTANLQHPPLIKELSALSAMAGGLRWPEAWTTRYLPTITPTSQPEWRLGASLIADNGPDHVLFWARLPMILVAGLLGLVLYLWGRDLVGDVPALCALFLYAFDPILLAHSSLITTDVGVTAFGLLFFMTLWRYVRTPGRSRLLCAGLALTAALGSKFSAVLLPPIGLLLLWAATLLWRPDDVKERRGSKGPILYARPFTGPLLIVGALLGIAAVAMQALYLFSSDPFLYIKGFSRIYADHTPGVQVYMAGQLQPRFLSYFAVAYLLKEPIASIVLALAGTVLIVRTHAVSTLAKAFILVPAVLLFAAVTLQAQNIGVRYVLPVLPFAWLLGGLALASLLRSSAVWTRAAGAALMAWLVVSAAGIYPDQMSYFNEAACLLHDYRQVGLDGGSRCGSYWLADQNVDWGQGTRQLKTWLDEHAPGRPIKWAHYVVFPPEGYGIRSESVEPTALLQNPPPPGLYVVSGHYVAVLPLVAAQYPQAGEWLRRTTPTAVIAHSLYVYDVEDPAGSNMPGRQDP
ncbi:MAG: ArnT family glycosyltransferase [Vicinamibacterales bacterium]